MSHLFINEYKESSTPYCARSEPGAFPVGMWRQLDTKLQNTMWKDEDTWLLTLLFRNPQISWKRHKRSHTTLHCLSWGSSALTYSSDDVQSRFNYFWGKINKPEAFPCVNEDLTAQSFEQFERDSSKWFNNNYCCRWVFEDVYKMKWPAMVTAVKASLPAHDDDIIARIKALRRYLADNIKDAAAKCQSDV